MINFGNEMVFFLDIFHEQELMGYCNHFDSHIKSGNEIINLAGIRSFQERMLDLGDVIILTSI